MLALGPEWSSNFLIERKFDGPVSFEIFTHHAPSLMSLSSPELYASLIGYLARFKIDPTPFAHRSTSVGMRPYLGDALFCAAIVGCCLIARGDEYLDEIIAAWSAVSIPPEAIAGIGLLRNGWFGINGILGHPNLHGSMPYDYAALRDRLVKVIVRTPLLIGCFYAEMLGHVVANAAMGPRLLEALPDEMFSWVASLPLPSNSDGNSERMSGIGKTYSAMQQMIDNVYSLLLSHEHPVGCLVENGFLTRLLDDHSELQRQGRAQFKKWLSEEVYVHELLLIEAPTTRTTAWKAFLDARSRFIDCLVQYVRQEATYNSDELMGPVHIISCALFDMDMPQLESRALNRNWPLLRERQKDVNWRLRFAKSLKDRTWDTDPKVRRDLLDELECEYLRHIPKSGIRALADAIRTPRGGNILHYILEGCKDPRLDNWYMLLDVADITKMDDDMRLPSSFLENPDALVDLLLDYRLDYGTNGNTFGPICLKQLMSSKCVRDSSNMEILQLELRGLFRSLESADSFFECLIKNFCLANALHAMTVFRIVWSSRIAFETIAHNPSLRTLISDVTLIDERLVWEGCLKRARMAIALCSIKATSVRASKSATSLRSLSIDLLRLILAYIWTGPNQ